MKKAKNRRHLLPLLVLLTLMIALVVPGVIMARTPAQQPQAKIERLVLDQLAAEGETDFFVWMTEKADLSPAAALKTKEEKGQFVFDTLRATAEATQKELRDYLDAQGITYRPFYIANKIYVENGNLETVMSIAAREDVAKITANHTIQLQEPFIDPAAAIESTQAIEPNITFVKAPDVWAMGYDGSGIVLAGNDTGLDWDHPALINQYRGWNGSTADHNYNWWDATGTYPTVPDDGHGHGTHTTGTMVGDDGAGNQIGVAPGAKTIHCKNMTNSGSGSDLTFSTCFEWDLAPWDLNGQNPQPSLAPHAINNSWGYWGGNDPVFEDEIAALRAAGIVVEVSAGNEGPSCSTLRSPGDYHQSLTTGSVNHFGTFPGTITGFSSRGPSALYPGEFVPDIMAPGENIRSSVPGGSFQGGWSGTSMAGPHVTALVALMWEASPNIAGDVALTEQIIIDTAVPLTGQTGSNCGGDYTTGPNNDWGFGTMDALAAVQEAIVLGGPFGVSATPESLDICTPTDAIYNVSVTLNEAFTDPVTLTATGNPGGTTATFSPNNQVPPFDSVLTIGNTGAASPGSYDIEIMGTSGSESASDTVELNVFTTTPGAVTLVAPANGSTNVALLPEFEWTAASQGSTYLLEVADDAGFSNVVYSATVAGTSHVATATLDPETEYFWRVTPENTCGTGSTSSTFSFTTRAVPPILLVDDDDNNPNVQATYTAVLDSLGQAYDIWDTNNSDNEPSAAELAPYTTVIWFTGDSFGGSSGPGGTGEAALATWLDSGESCLFISSQDYLWDRGITPFMTGYLGVSSGTSDVSQSTVTGAGSVFSGLGPYALSYPFNNYSDTINPDGTAEVAFTGNAGNAAINKDTGVYRSTYWGFPFEAIPAAERETVMSTVLNWCGALGETGTLEGTVTDADSGEGIAGATITAVGPGNFSTQTDANGDYSLTLTVGTYDVTASADNYQSVTANNVDVITGTTTTQDFVLQGSSLTYSPDEIEESMEIGDVVINTVTVTNTGPLDIDWSVSFGNFGGPGSLAVVPRSVQPLAPVSGQSTVVVPRGQENAATTAGLNLPTAPVNGTPLNAGDVIDSWAITGIPAGWGIAMDGTNLWISSPGSSWGGNATITQYSLDGTPGVSYPYTWNPANGPADLAYNWNTGMLWAMDVGQGNCIHEIDPASGVTGNTICPPFAVSQRGLAYDPVTDTYLAASWNDLTIYRFDTSGAMLEQVFVGLAVSGLAYNPDTMHLFVMTNDAPNPVHVLDAANGYASVGQFNVSEGFSDYAGAGLEFDCDGNLWAVDQILQRAYLFESGETVGLCDGGGGWVYAAPNSGTIPANSSATFDVIFDATSLFELGTYTAEMNFSGTFVNDVPPMPLTMHLGCPNCGFLEGSITDVATGDPLVADINITNGVFDVTVTGDTYSVAVQPGTYDINVSADDYLSQTETVTVASGETVVTDFALLSIFGELYYSPDEIEEFMEIGDVVTNTVTVTNTSPLDMDISVKFGNFGGPGSLRPVAPAGTGEWLYRAEEGVLMPANGGERLAYPSAYRWEAAQATAGGNILVYADDAVHLAPNTFVDQALQSLGLSYTAHYDGDWAGFEASLGSGTWDMVLVANDNWGPPLTVLSALNAYVQGGGKLAYHSWTVSDDPGNPLFATLGFSWSSNDTDPPAPVYWWEPGHALFNNPESVPEFTNLTGFIYGIYGQMGEPLAGFEALAGYTTPGPDPNQAALILGNDNRTVFKAFLDGQNDADLDSDGVKDGAELWINLISGLQSGFGGADWVYAVPDSVTIPANGTATFDVVFDATSLFELGTYTAEMSFSGPFINDVPPMPLTMHLSCPDCGVLEGSITDAVTGDPLEADIQITDGVFDVTVSGDSYSVAVQPGTYDIIVSADDYIGQTETVTVAAGETVVTDFALLPIFSELDYMPDHFEATLPLGGVATQTMTINNLGTVSFDFSLRDVETGSPLSSAPVMYPLGSVEFSAPAAIGPASVRSAEGQAALAALETPMAWANGAPIPSSLVRYAHAQCAEEPDTFYVIAGVSDGSIIGNTRRYNAATDSWTELAPIPIPQEGPAAVCYEGYIYVAGGGGTNQFFIYDIANNSWASGPALPRNVWGAAMGAYDGKVYMIGGDSDFFFGGTSNAVNIYDIASGTWSTGANMPVAAVTAGSVQAGQYVYVVGGWGDSSPTSNINATQRYDMSSNTWETGPTFTSARADFALAVTTSNLYAIGGDADGGGAFDASTVVESLDHTAWPGGSWTNVGDPLPSPLTANNAGFCTNVITGGEVWSVGGLDSSFVFHNFNQYRSAEACFVGGPQDALWLHETPDSGTVEAGGSMEVSIVFDATVITTTGTYTAEIIFSGTYDNQVERATAVLHVVGEAEYGVSLSGDMAASGGAGETVVYNVTVTNEGNVNDTFNLVLSGETWTSTLSDDSVTLAPGESATVTVEVTIPADASDGDTDTVTITATSVNDPSATASANLTTTAVVEEPEPEEFVMFLPIMLKQP